MKADLQGLEVALERFSFSRRINFIAIELFHEPRILEEEPVSKRPVNQQDAAKAILHTPKHHLFVSRCGDIWIGLNWNRPVHKKRHANDMDPAFNFSLAVGSGPGLQEYALTEKCISTCADIVAFLQTRFSRTETGLVELVVGASGSPPESFAASLTEIRNQAASMKVSHGANKGGSSLYPKIPFERDALESEEKAEYILAFLISNA